MIIIILSRRQLKIVKVVKENQPITSNDIAKHLNLTRETLRSDLSLLTMVGILDAKPGVGYFIPEISQPQPILFEDDVKERKVEDVMSMPVVIKKNISLYDTIVEMFLTDMDCESIFIIDDEKNLCGMVSKGDLLKATVTTRKLDLDKVPIEMIMTTASNIITVQKDDKLISAINKIADYDVNTIPVVKNNQNGKNEVIGIISRKNITLFFLEIINKYI